MEEIEKRTGRKMRTAKIIVPQAFLYEENPQIAANDEKSNVADQVLMGWTVGILDVCKDYLRVRTHYGYEGWLSIHAVHGSDYPERVGNDENTCVIISRFADVMTIPSVRGIVLSTLARGSFVQLLREDEENGYCFVKTASGRQGYVPKVSIRKRMDTDQFLTKGTLFTDASMFPVDFREPQNEEKFREHVIETAKGYLGTPYRWGGKTPEGIDCSGLAFMSYLINGVLIYRDAVIRDGYPIHEIPRELAKKGDLFFFPGHVAIYLGEEKFIHSTGSVQSFGCVINSFDSKDPDYREDLANSITAVGSIF